MTTFYDYDLTVRNGFETYHLRANMKRLPIGFCRITVADDGTARRVTEWHSKHGRREEWYPNVEAALTAGIKWARRREKEDAR